MANGVRPPGLGDEAGVGEGHRGVVRRLPERRERSHAADQQRGIEQDRQRDLDEDGREGDGAQQLPDLAEPHGLTLVDRPAVRACGVGVSRGDELRAQPEPLGDDQAQDRGEREDAHRPDIDADEDDRLPEAGPVRAHVDGGQAGHADGRHRGEQRIGEWRPLSVGRRGRHREQRGEERDQGREDQDGEPGGRGGRQIAQVIPHSPDAPTQARRGEAAHRIRRHTSSPVLSNSSSWYCARRPTSLSPWRTSST